ncbi:9137_t:CDS:1, partial [Paraglomus occultum]
MVFNYCLLYFADLCFIWRQAIIVIRPAFSDRHNPFFTEMATAPNNIIENFKLGHGLLFDQSGLRFARKSAVQVNCSIEESPKTKPSVQLINIHKIRDTYIYANNLTLDKDDPLFNPPKPFSHFKENNPFYDETPDKT